MMRTTTILRFASALALAGALAACDDNDADIVQPPAATPPPVATPSPTPTSATYQSRFGSNFAAIFNAPATGQPVEPDDNSVPPLAPAAQPIDDGVL